jgi:hypothetical protein
VPRFERSLPFRISLGPRIGGSAGGAVGITHSEHSNDLGRLGLARDGKTILRQLRGRTEDGGYFDGYQEYHPGDLGYEEMLPAAQENPAEDNDLPERPVDPGTLARVLREAGLDEEVSETRNCVGSAAAGGQWPLPMRTDIVVTCAKSAEG